MTCLCMSLFSGDKVEHGHRVQLLQIMGKLLEDIRDKISPEVRPE